MENRKNLNDASRSIDTACQDLREAHRKSDGFGEIVLRNLLEEARALQLKIAEAAIVSDGVK